ncbi:MAG: hypothetical protein RBR15_15595 [Sphaerochaeta sp.]|nr:hypothetical protein [Sphaerochaeta sp.]
MELLKQPPTIFRRMHMHGIGPLKACPSVAVVRQGSEGFFSLVRKVNV